MKARVGIIVLVLSLSVFTLTCKDNGESNIDKNQVKNGRDNKVVLDSYISIV